MSVPTGATEAELTAYILESGCADITGAMHAIVNSGVGVDIGTLRWMAEFVETSPPDTQAAPKGNGASTSTPPVDDGGMGGGGKGSEFEM